MPTPALIALYCSLILAASLAGGMVPMLIRLTHNRVQLAISFVSGFMLAVAVLLLLPHAILENPAGPGAATVSAVQWLLVGLLAMFFIERFFSFHHHDAPDELAAAEAMREQSIQTYSPEGAAPAKSSPAGDEHTHCGHNHGHAHHHHHGHDHHHPADGAVAGTPLTWSGAAVGLTLHSIVDGIALAAAIETQVGGHGIFAGLAVFLVILLHKPFDSMTLTTLMGLGGWSMLWRHVVNGLFALTLVLGIALFYLAQSVMGETWLALEGNAFVSAALAFSAGTFLCIALSDLLPELQFHRHDRLKLSTALLIGVALAWAVAFFESQTHDHSHAGHSHSHGEHHHDLDH